MNEYSKGHRCLLNKKRKIAELARNFDYDAFLNETNNDSSTTSIDLSINNTDSQDASWNGLEHADANEDHIQHLNDISQHDDIQNENPFSIN